MKPPEIGIRSLAAVARDPRRSTSEYERCLGLGAECTKASAAASGRRSMSLDIPSYRTSSYATPVGSPRLSKWPGNAHHRNAALPFPVGINWVCYEYSRGRVGDVLWWERIRKRRCRTTLPRIFSLTPSLCAFTARTREVQIPVVHDPNC